MKFPSCFTSLFLALSLGAQEPLALDAPKAVPSDALPKVPSVVASPTDSPEIQKVRMMAQAKEESAVDAAKAADSGPRRFAEDLFRIRQVSPLGTEGGIAEDYVLGVGDQVVLNAYGSATFDIPAQVDGRGLVVIPKVGTVKVAGLSLAKARAAIQAKVAQQFSRTTVDLAVVKLREIRVFVLGEVYKPGSYLVPSLSNLVNVLSLAGGPTSAGSFREIRVLRGGQIIHKIDLYPLRTEGRGNLNFALQSGDTLFVPLAFNQIILEGAFTRVVAPGPAEAPVALGLNGKAASQDTFGGRGDQRISARSGQETVSNALAQEYAGQPSWLVQWLTTGKAPSMQFELLPGETVADAVHFAGGLTVEAFADTLNLRRMGPGGVVDAQDVSLQRAQGLEMRRGDILSALSRRTLLEKVVTVAGWVRVRGTFARTEGLRVGDLLRRENQVLPDTYLYRGEIVRTLPDMSTTYLAFDVGKAIAGDSAHNLPLQDRDRVELYRTTDFRLPETVQVVGPILRPGTYALHAGMRASDLLFQAGVLLHEANRYVAELAHTREGKPSEIRPLNLPSLLSSEHGSPVHLEDDALNPVLQPLDQLSIYAKPDYRAHRTVSLSGQVARPGVYVLDGPHVNLRDILVRAGGFTPDAMPQSGIFLRDVAQGMPSDVSPAAVTKAAASNPTLAGISGILDRLSETKRQPTSGALLKSPILHGLGSGSLNRLVVDFPAVLAGDAQRDVELQDGDQIIIPRRTETAFVVGETASPFMSYKVSSGQTVKELLQIAGGFTRNADKSHVRLLKANGRIIDNSVMGQEVQPGDAILVPQKILRDTTWQENLNALTPIAILLNALKL